MLSIDVTIVTYGVAWSVVCLSVCFSVCWSRSWALLKQLPRLRCRFGCRLGWTQGIMYQMACRCPHGNRHLCLGHTGACSVVDVLIMTHKGAELSDAARLLATITMATCLMLCREPSASKEMDVDSNKDIDLGLQLPSASSSMYVCCDETRNRNWK